MADARSNGVFIFAVLLMAALALQLAGVGGLGTERYSQLAALMLVGAGALSYFTVAGAEVFGIANGNRAIAYAGIALAFALVFTVLLVNSPAGVLATISMAVVVACAAPLIGLFVRSWTAGGPGTMGSGKGSGGTGGSDAGSGFGQPISVSGVANTEEGKKADS